MFRFGVRATGTTQPPLGGTARRCFATAWRPGLAPSLHLRNIRFRSVMPTRLPTVSAWCPMPTELTTPRLHLDAWRDDDIDDYETLVSERGPRTAAAPRGGRPTRDDLRETILRQQASHADTGIGLLVIRTADRFAGYCGLTVGRASLAEPELAYELLHMNRGNGYATEAARATVDAAVGTGRRRLWATVRTWNDASFRVLKKVGFERTDRITTDAFGESVWCTREL